MIVSCFLFYSWIPMNLIKKQKKIRNIKVVEEEEEEKNFPLFSNIILPQLLPDSTHKNAPPI